MEGLETPEPPLDPVKAREFVYGKDAAMTKSTSPANTATLTRSPLSTRIRSDFAAALKRASLERQLNSVEPSTLQDILEQAIEPWLKSNGYIS
jgi:hypothetical protein